MKVKLGYLIDDWIGVTLKPISALPVKANARWKVKDCVGKCCTSRQLEVVLNGACFFKPRVYPESVDYSLRKRLMHQPPQGRHDLLHELRGFVWRWCRRHLQPLDRIMGFEEWLATTNYSARQKEHFRQVFSRRRKSVEECVVKCFVKDEEYAEPKAPRMIASREDDAKVVLGPIFKSMEQVVFDMPYFVKHLTPTQRVAKINAMFGRRPVWVTDYSSFETHFTRQMMSNCEFVLYDYLLANFPEERKLIRVLKGKNHLVSKWFVGDCEAVRMSGEMNTSLGNGISNLFFMLFAAYKTGSEVLNIVVEGDDGLVELKTPIPRTFFTDLGLEIKMDLTVPYKASFCGCVYNPYTLTNFGHPLDALMKLGWSNTRALAFGPKKIHELTMSKIYSMCAEFPGVPLLWKVCRLAVERFAPVSFARAVKYRDRYKARDPLTDRTTEPSVSDREYFTELTGIGVEAQFAIEREFEESFPELKSASLMPFVPWLNLDGWRSVVEMSSDSLRHGQPW